MRHLIVTGVAISSLALVGCKEKSSPAPSATPSVASPAAGANGPNAADTYRRIAGQLDKGLDVKTPSDVDGARPVLSKHKANIEAIIEASRATEADWGVDYSQGFNTLLPHLGEARSLARLLNADALRCLADGDGDGACKRYATILRIAKHTTANAHSMIEWITASALVSMSADGIKENAGALKAAGWKTDIQTELAGLRGNAPLRLKDIYKAERDLIIPAVRNNKISPETGVNLSGLSAADREQAAKDLDSAFTQILAVIEQSPTTRTAAMKKIAESPAAKGPAGGLLVAPENIAKAADRLVNSINEAAAAIGM